MVSTRVTRVTQVTQVTQVTHGYTWLHSDLSAAGARGAAGVSLAAGGGNFFFSRNASVPRCVRVMT